MADILRGCEQTIWHIEPLFDAMQWSKINCGICVVFPQPVLPTTRIIWFLWIASRIVFFCCVAGRLLLDSKRLQYSSVWLCASNSFRNFSLSAGLLWAFNPSHLLLSTNSWKSFWSKSLKRCSNSSETSVSSDSASYLCSSLLISVTVRSGKQIDGP